MDEHERVAIAYYPLDIAGTTPQQTVHIVEQFTVESGQIEESRRSFSPITSETQGFSRLRKKGLPQLVLSVLSYLSQREITRVCTFLEHSCCHPERSWEEARGVGKGSARSDYVCAGYFGKYYVYITSQSHGEALHRGHRRPLPAESKIRRVPSFTSKYFLEQLVYFEDTNDIGAAIASEKELKEFAPAQRYSTLYKRRIPQWSDLGRDLIELRNQRKSLRDDLSPVPPQLRPASFERQFLREQM